MPEAGRHLGTKKQGLQKRERRKKDYREENLDLGNLTRSSH